MRLSLDIASNRNKSISLIARCLPSFAVTLLKLGCTCTLLCIRNLNTLNNSYFGILRLNDVFDKTYQLFLRYIVDG